MQNNFRYSKNKTLARVQSINEAEMENKWAFNDTDANCCLCGNNKPITSLYKIDSYCLFCFRNNKCCIFMNQKSHYSHSNSCKDCIHFKNYLVFLNNNALELISQIAP